MRYTLFLYYQEMSATAANQEMMEAGKQAFHDYAKALDDAGVLISAEVLQTVANSTTLALRDRSLRIQDGPFADTKEQIGGTFVIDVPDLDAALAWAEKCPAAQWGTIEIRPSAVRFVDGKWVAVA